MVDQLWSWHTHTLPQRDTVADLAVPPALDRAPRARRRRRTIYAIALAAALGAGGVTAAKQWSSEPTGDPPRAQVPLETGLQTRLPMLSRRVGRRSSDATRAPDLVQPQAPRPAPRHRAAQRTIAPQLPPTVATTMAPDGETPAVPALPSYLDRPAVRDRLLRARDQVKQCYDSRLVADPTLAGMVSASFDILPGGRVTSSLASGVDSDLASCVRHVLDGLTFGKSRHRLQVHYPFRFVVRDVRERRMSW